MARGQRERKTGRYDGVGGALNPGGLLPEGKYANGNVQIAHARLVDPKAELLAAHLQSGGKFQQTMVNIARDPLEREFRYGRLDNLQHAAGIRYRDLILWARGQGDPGASRGHSSAHDANEYRILRRMEAAGAANALRDEAVRICGARGEMILTTVLGDEKSFRETANLIGSEPGAPSFWRAQVGASRVAERFRDALKRLADEWLSKRT